MSPLLIMFSFRSMLRQDLNTRRIFSVSTAHVKYGIQNLLYVSSESVFVLYSSVWRISIDLVAEIIFDLSILRVMLMNSSKMNILARVTSLCSLGTMKLLLICSGHLYSRKGGK